MHSPWFAIPMMLATLATEVPMLIEQPKLEKLFSALDTVRSLLPELAIILPSTAMVDGALVAAMPTIEQGIGLLFEAAVVASESSSPDEARDRLTAAIQAKAQAALDAKFKGG
jgi:hypothetical protein